MPISWPGINFTKPASKKYLEVTFFPNTTDRLFIGSDDPHQHQGIYQVVVHWNIGDGEYPARRVAGAIADHFPTDLRVTLDGVVVQVAKRPDVASALVENEGVQIPVSISYRAFV
jgi:hypothetical protein